MAKKTKILAIGDIHGDVGLVRRLARRADRENVDFVILAGDLASAEDSLKNLVGPFVNDERKILLLHGNHEGIATVDFLSDLYPNTKNIHGYGFVQNGVGIFGVGGADFGLDAMSEKDFRELIGKSHSRIKNAERKIMVTHMHPRGTKSEFSGFEGSKSIREAIEKYRPDFALFSHIHEAGGIEERIGKTRVINVARKEIVFEI
jgi:Icc-related predicted phosphoesterase